MDLSDESLSFFWVFAEGAVLLYCFLAMAIVADSHLVPSLETLCVRWSVREDVAGASFMAFGSAAPEIIMNAIQSIKGGEADTDLGIGGIIGSGMIAFTVIPGVCGLCASDTLLLKRRPLARDAGFYGLALLILCRAFADGVVELREAAAMVALYGVYLAVVVFSPGIRQLYRVNYLGRAPRTQACFVTEATSTSSLPVKEGGGPVVMQVICTAVREGEAEGEAAGAAEAWDAEPVLVSPMEVCAHADACASLGDLRLAAPPSPPAAPRAASAAEAAGAALVRPLRFVLRWTCPECAHDGPRAAWYPLTFLVSFAWVAALSTLIAAVVSAWGARMGTPPSLLGMYVVAIGAEIPDAIASVSVARRGYGSMAVSNSSGSQILNILIGLGLPWALACLTRRPVRVGHPAQIQLMACFQAAILAFFVSLAPRRVLLVTMRTWRRGDHSKAHLGRRKGVALLGVYALVLIAYPFAVLSRAANANGGGGAPASTPAIAVPASLRLLELDGHWHRHEPHR